VRSRLSCLLLCPLPPLVFQVVLLDPDVLLQHTFNRVIGCHDRCNLDHFSLLRDEEFFCVLYPHGSLGGVTQNGSRLILHQLGDTLEDCVFCIGDYKGGSVRVRLLKPCENFVELNRELVKLRHLLDYFIFELVEDSHD